ncbi:MAG TPA: metallophosphoesterase [Terriglobales bacterium]|nr:metallophosphoesterase [Terriglobales bacterium]
MRSFYSVLFFLSVCVSSISAGAQHVAVKLPLHAGSVRFAVIGDSGTGNKEQFEVAQELERYRQDVKFDFVIMLGDNIYGGHSASDFKRKFEEPYKSLLDAGVKFYASLGNHDDPNIERLYKPFNMNGERYYTFKRGNVQFYALDSTYMDTRQLRWLEQNLRSSNAGWKICYFHHPLYSDGKMHGPDLDLRNQLTPLLKAYGVNAIFSGHEHAYERIKPQNGIYYFIQGDSGKLEHHDFHRSEQMQTSYDRDRTFMLVEIDGDNLYFQTVARSGETVDAGVLTRQIGPARARK